MNVDTLEKARELNLEVYLLPPTNRYLIEAILRMYRNSGRDVTEFPVEIHGFKLTAVAGKQKPGVIAPVMKERKTVRSVIHEERENDL